MSTNFLDHVPAVPPPPGEVSNFIDPPSRAHAVTVLDGVFVALMLIAVLIRILTRVRFMKIWGWDDTFCILAALGSLSHAILYSQMIKIGYGRHIWDIPASWLLPPQNIRLSTANGITFPLTILFTKLSILIFYLRIFGLISRPFKVIVYVGSVLLVLFYTAMVIVAINSLVKCVHIDQMNSAFCQTYSGPIVVLNATFNVATDFWLLVMPIPLLSILHLKSGRKWGVGVVFGAGTVACAASLVRMVELIRNYRTSDIFWLSATNSLYTIVELNIAIIVACTACFPAFYAKVAEYVKTATIADSLRRLGSSGKESKTSSSNDGWGEMMAASGELPKQPSYSSVRPLPPSARFAAGLAEVELPHIRTNDFQS